MEEIIKGKIISKIRSWSEIHNNDIGTEWYLFYVGGSLIERRGQRLFELMLPHGNILYIYIYMVYLIIIW